MTRLLLGCPEMALQSGFRARVLSTSLGRVKNCRNGRLSSIPACSSPGRTQRHSSARVLRGDVGLRAQRGAFLGRFSAEKLDCLLLASTGRNPLAACPCIARNRALRYPHGFHRLRTRAPTGLNCPHLLEQISPRTLRSVWSAWSAAAWDPPATGAHQPLRSVWSVKSVKTYYQYIHARPYFLDRGHGDTQGEILVMVFH